MSSGRAARLAEAVAMLEGDLKKAYDEAVHLSNDLIKSSDEIALELRRHIDDAASRAIAEMRKEADAVMEKMLKDHEENLKRELSALEAIAVANSERAVARVAEEIKKLLGEA